MTDAKRAAVWLLVTLLLAVVLPVLCVGSAWLKANGSF